METAGFGGVACVYVYNVGLVDAVEIPPPRLGAPPPPPPPPPPPSWSSTAISPQGTSTHTTHARTSMKSSIRSPNRFGSVSPPHR